MKEMAMSLSEKLKIQLSDESGNVFSILGRCSRAMRLAGVPTEERDKFMKEAKSGDYDHVIQTVMKYFDVE
jgi:hypothetical protein